MYIYIHVYTHIYTQLTFLGAEVRKAADTLELSLR